MVRFENEYSRALCLSTEGKTFKIQYIDYGNSVTVSAKDIRRMPKELALPIFVHNCYVKNCDGKLTEKQLKILEEGLIEITNITVDESRNCYALDIVDLD